MNFLGVIFPFNPPPPRRYPTNPQTSTIPRTWKKNWKTMQIGSNEFKWFHSFCLYALHFQFSIVTDGNLRPKMIWTNPMMHMLFQFNIDCQNTEPHISHIPRKHIQFLINRIAIYILYDLHKLSFWKKKNNQQENTSAMLTFKFTSVVVVNSYYFDYI